MDNSKDSFKSFSQVSFSWVRQYPKRIEWCRPWSSYTRNLPYVPITLVATSTAMLIFLHHAYLFTFFFLTLPPGYELLIGSQSDLLTTNSSPPVVCLLYNKSSMNTWIMICKDIRGSSASCLREFNMETGQGRRQMLMKLLSPLFWTTTSKRQPCQGYLTII